MPARDGNRSPRDDRSWGSRAKDFVICAEAALRGKKGDPYPLNNSSLGRWVGLGEIHGSAAIGTKQEGCTGT